MADPEKLASIWFRATQEFPELIEKWGAELPEDRERVLSALQDYSTLQSAPTAVTPVGEPVDPTATVVKDRRRLALDVHELAQPIDPATVKDPTYFTSKYWGDIKDKLLTGLEDMSPLATLPFRDKLIPSYRSPSDKLETELEESMAKTGEEPSYWQRALTRLEPTIGIAEASAEMSAPLTALLYTGVPGFRQTRNLMREPGVPARMDILKERGGAPGALGHIERLASAYQQSIEAGEIPWWKQIAGEIPTDVPLDILTGGIYAKPFVKGITAGARAFPKIGREVVEAAPDVSRTAPSDIGAMQRALPIETTPEGTLRAIPQEQLSEEAAGQLGFGDVPTLPPKDAMGQSEFNLFNFGGPRLDDMPAEDLMRQQAGQPTFGWSPNQPVGSQVYPSGKPRSWKVTDITKKDIAELPESFQPQFPFVDDISSYSFPNPTANLSNKAKHSLEKLLAYRQKNIDVDNPGFKRWTTTWTKEAAQEIFGDTSAASMGKINGLLDNLPGTQQVLPMDHFGQVAMDLKGSDAGNIWKTWLEDNYILNEELGEYVLRTDRPLPPTRKGWNGIDEESATSSHIDRVTPKRGVPSTPDKKISDWIRNLPMIEGRILDDFRKAWKTFATPGELSSPKGILGWFKKGIESPHIPALRLYGGTVRQHDRYMATVIAKGTKELQDLGWADKNGTITQEALGTWDNPGPVRILFNALHDKSWLPQVKQMGPDAERQYENLRNLTNWEETLRGGDDIKLKEFDPISDEQYFYRGVMPENGDFVLFQNNLNKLGRTKSIEMHRIQKHWLDLQEAGLRPLSWNPYEQAMLSSRIGLHGRMQTQMLELLKTPELNMAQKVDVSDIATVDRLTKAGYRQIREAGPAMRGEKLYGVPHQFRNVANPEQHLRNVEYRWYFPSDVANSMEDFFAPKSSMVKWLQKETDRKVLGRRWKPDDIFFLTKRSKLFGSFFQHVDMAQTAVFSGFATSLDSMLETMIRAGKGEIDRGTFFKELVESTNHTWRIPQQIASMARAAVDVGYRAQLRDAMLDATPWFDDPRYADYNNLNAGIQGLGLHDPTIYSSDDAIRLLEEVQVELGWKKKAFGIATYPFSWTGNMIKQLEKAFSEGLFEGIYHAGAYHDFRYNIVPLTMKVHGDTLNPNQTLGLSAKRANILWSTIPPEQSVIKGQTKDILKRVLFSINEQERFARQYTGMFRGESKRFFRMRSVGAIFSTIMAANLIHYKVTGEPLPLRRYMPFQYRGWYTAFYGYAPQFLSPDFPIPDRAGDRTTLDLLLQYDFALRMLDGAYGLPLIGGLDARLGTVPRWIMTQATGKDFRGRDIAKWGFLQRAIQGIYDLTAPIGLGQIGAAFIVNSMGDKELPAIGGTKFPILLEGATLKDIIPTSEVRLSSEGSVFQGATGLNLKAYGNDELRDRMTNRIFGNGTDPQYPGLVLRKYSDIDKDPDKYDPLELRTYIANHALNFQESNEMKKRAEEGFSFDWYDRSAQAIHHINKLNEEKLKEEAAVALELASDSLWSNKEFGSGKEAWSPSSFKRRMKIVNSAHRVRIESAEQIYGYDPLTKQVLEKRQEEPNRSEEPLQWAIWHWNRIRDENTNTIGEVNYKKFDKEWDFFTSQWDDDDMKETGGLEERFNTWMQGLPFTHSNHHPLFDQYYDDMRRLDNAHYWQDGPRIDKEKSDIAAGNIVYVNDEFYHRLNELQHHHGPNLQAAQKTAVAVWSDYLSETIEGRRLMESEESAPYFVVSIIKTMKLVRKNHRYNVLLENPELDQIAIKWMGNTPTHMSNREFYRDLYGKFPSQIRQPPYR